MKKKPRPVVAVFLEIRIETRRARRGEPQMNTDGPKEG